VSGGDGKPFWPLREKLARRRRQKAYRAAYDAIVDVQRSLPEAPEGDEDARELRVQLTRARWVAGYLGWYRGNGGG